MLKRFLHYYKKHKLIKTLDLIAAFLIAIIGVDYQSLLSNARDWVPNGEVTLIFVGGAILVGIYLCGWVYVTLVQFYGHDGGKNAS